MKRIFVFAICLLLAGQAWAYDFQSGDLYYNITSSTEPYEVEVTYYNQFGNGIYATMTTANIPQTVTNSETGITYTVVGIGEEAFHDAVELLEVKYPETVRYIGRSAFSCCKKLPSITLPSGLTAIGRHTFNGAESLTSIEIPSTVTSIGYCAFNSCASLTSVTIPNSVKGELDNTFSNCTNLKTVVVGDGVTSIDEFAFSGCKSLETVTLGSAVTKIGWCSFKFCGKLKSIVIPEGVTAIGDDAFFGCYELESVSIPSTVTEIGGSAFVDCKSLVSVELPSGIKAINGATFSGCHKLESVNIPAAVTSIGYSAFEGCSSLKSIEIPASVQTIGRYAFADDSLIVSVVIPEKVTKIDDYTFLNCVNLSSVTIPSSVTEIGWYAFKNCTSLISIDVPVSVKTIGIDAFKGVKNLIYNVETDGETWGALCVNGYVEDDYVYFDNTKRNIVAYFGSDTKVVIPSTVKYISDDAFGNCTKLTSVVIPKSVTGVGFDAFAGCDNLTIYCEAESATDDFDENWDGGRPVVWGYSGGDIEEPATYTITLSASLGGTVSGGGTFKEGKEIEIKATANDGYHFLNWSDGNTENPRSITVSEDMALTAVFEYEGSQTTEPDKYTITLSATNGTVSGGGTFEKNTEIQIKATPDNGYHFVRWSDGNKENPRSITVSEDMALTAVFEYEGSQTTEPDKYTITLSATNGTVSGGGTFEKNTEIQIKATPDNGYHFVRWSDGNKENPRSITVTKNMELTAEISDKYKISAKVKGEGWVSGTGSFSYGQTVTIKATADDNYHFSKWNDGDKNRTRTITVTEDLELTATFSPDLFEISVQKTDGGKIKGADIYSYGEEVEIKAVPDEGYKFVSWNDGNTDNPRTVIVKSDKTYSAEFAPMTYTITIDAENGTVTGFTGDFASGDTATLTAIAADGFRFVCWSDSTTDNPHIVTITADLALTAVFEADVNPEEQTAISESAANVVNIYASGSTIVVENASSEVRVYNVMGSLVTIVNEANAEIKINLAGIYFVKVGNIAKRVVIN